MSNSVPASPARRKVLTNSAAILASGVGSIAQAQGSTSFPLPLRPEDVHPYFSRAFNAGDLNAIMKMYVSDAIFVPKPGTMVKGHDAIRASMVEFMDLKLPIKTQHKQILVSGDVALLISDWTIEGKGSDGKPMKMTGTSSDVVRRQTNGTWLVLIDNPFGSVW